MKSVTRVVPFSPTLVKLFIAAAVACCLFSYMAPAAQAAGLTEAQIQAIENLMVSFGADQATIVNVDAALRGKPTPSNVPSMSIGGIGGVYKVGDVVTWGPYVKNAPAGSRVCMTMVRESDGFEFAFPPTGGCTSLMVGDQLVQVQGTILSSRGYELTAGTYHLRARMSMQSDGEKDGATLAQADSNQFTITTVSPSTPAQTNPVSISFFTVSPSSIKAGQTVAFSWSSNLSSTDLSYYGGFCTIEGLTETNRALYVTTTGNHDPSGAVSYAPPATATYKLICTSGAKDGSPSAQKTVMVSVAIAPATSTQPSTAAAIITPDALSYAPGATMRVTWSYTGSTNAKDWVGIVARGGTWGSAPNNGPAVSWFYTDAANSGTKTLVAPSAPGGYDLVYFPYNTMVERGRSGFMVSGSVSDANNAQQGSLAAVAAAMGDLTNQVAAVFAAPVEISIDALTDLFIYAGIGQ